MTLETLTKVDDVPIYVRIETRIVRAMAKENAEGKDKKNPPLVCRVVNLETGEELRMVCNTMLASELIDNYPDDGYIGREFEIIQYSERGKGYKKYHVFEIEWDEDHGSVEVD